MTARAEGNRLALLARASPVAMRRERLLGTLRRRPSVRRDLRQTDPLIVLDCREPIAIQKLGELEIPASASTLHPLDATHIITVGQSATRGIQRQLFDVTDPKNLPLPKLPTSAQFVDRSQLPAQAFTFSKASLRSRSLG